MTHVLQSDQTKFCKPFELKSISNKINFELDPFVKPMLDFFRSIINFRFKLNLVVDQVMSTEQLKNMKDKPSFDEILTLK